MKRTFVDSGVLIAAARGQEDVALRAMSILDDPDREFASSAFVKLEIIPKAAYYGRHDEVRLYEEFFAAVAREPESLEAVVREAHSQARAWGLGAVDALHVAAAVLTDCDELVTPERPGKPIYRVKSVRVVGIVEAKP